MMETFRRSRDLEGLPRLEIESPEEFFDAAIAEYPAAPRWVGELYFEMHRGTFTSQAGTKWGNRRSELLLREAELWCTAAAVATGDAAGYPAEELDRSGRPCCCCSSTTSSRAARSAGSIARPKRPTPRWPSNSRR